MRSKRDDSCEALSTVPDTTQKKSTVFIVVTIIVVIINRIPQPLAFYIETGCFDFSTH